MLPPDESIDQVDTDVKPNVIDPGESLLCVTGVRPVVTKKVETIDAQQRKQARQLPQVLQKLSRQLINDELTAPGQIEPYSYNDLLDALTTGLDEQQLADMVDTIRSGDLGLAYTTVAHRAVQYLQAVLPKSIYQTQASAQNLQISDPDWWGFQEQYELLDNPLSVFDLMASGELRPSHVHCLRTVYPTLGVAIDDALDDAIATEVGRKKSFELPLYVDFGVATWRGDPPSPAPYQNAYAQQQAVKDAQPSSPESKSPLAAEAETSTEAALYKSAGLKA